MIPSRTLLVLAAAVALSHLAACSKPEPVARAVPPPPSPYALEAPPAPPGTPTAVPAPSASPAEGPGDPAPSPEEVAAVEHPRVAK